MSPYWWAFIIGGVFLLFFGVFFVLYPASAWTLFSITYRTFFLVQAAFTLSMDILVLWLMNVENNCGDLTILFIFNAVSGVGIGTVLAILYPVAPAEDTICF